MLATAISKEGYASTCDSFTTQISCGIICWRPTSKQLGDQQISAFFAKNCSHSTGFYGRLIKALSPQLSQAAGQIALIVAGINVWDTAHLYMHSMQSSHRTWAAANIAICQVQLLPERGVLVAVVERPG